MSNINYQALRMAAENATPGEWCSDDYYGVIADSGMNGNYYIALCSGPDKRANKRFIAAANPATVLALLDEREAQSKRIAELEANLAALAAENAGLNKFIVQSCYVFDGEQDELSDAYICAIDGRMPQTPATDAFLAEVKTEARKEGAYFVANRMLAAWEAGFIDDTAKNAADIARMILTSTEFMANAPEGDFDRSFSDGVLEDIAEQLRKGGKQ
ncbi:ead/Ea22-like family protein [Escherichia coli]|uniref:ead/Ea22-like family protein n=1 Tax=Escherichia TaxID=561 RepID=UPI0002E2D40F|nr:MULTISPECIES: ead/Ea22-like family protein [Escherichia]MDQ9211401.1 ead/Ea22-like family protein [Escherichia marmotae]MEC9675666.1 ead/Ea22-like family protein [Escherichia coli]MED0066454.1 ead/Ea22-like family protein [Escherichia coli]MED0130397.1 ead/Ea22-like family protein [Escherichia coli]MED0141940.1 ead/Ea22-like family protein [Escherichia coli]